ERHHGEQIRGGHSNPAGKEPRADSEEEINRQRSGSRTYRPPRKKGSFPKGPFHSKKMEERVHPVGKVEQESRMEKILRIPGVLIMHAHDRVYLRNLIRMEIRGKPEIDPIK